MSAFVYTAVFISSVLDRLTSGKIKHVSSEKSGRIQQARHSTKTLKLKKKNSTARSRF